MPIEEIQAEITNQLNEAHNRLTQGNITLEEAIEINNLLSSASILLFSDTILSQINYNEESRKNFKKVLIIQLELSLSGFFFLYTPLLSILGMVDGFKRLKELKNRKDTSNIPTLMDFKKVIDLRRDLLGRKVLLLANGNNPLSISEEEKERLVPYAIKACNILAEYSSEQLPEIANQVSTEERNIINALLNQRIESNENNLKRIKENN